MTAYKAHSAIFCPDRGGGEEKEGERGGENIPCPRSILRPGEKSAPEYVEGI
jgi:hypothetical protein